MGGLMVEVYNPDTAHYIYCDLDVVEASRFLLEHQIDSVRVLGEDNAVVGLLSSSHLLQTIVEGLPANTPVQKIMSCNVDESVYKNYELYSDNTDNTVFSDLLWSKKSEFGIILDAIYKPIVAIDTDGKIVLFNKCMEETFGIVASDAYGRKITDIIDNSELAEILTTGERQSLHKLEWQGKTYLSTRGPIVFNNQIIGAVAVIQEMSELDAIVDELEAVKKLNRQLDALFEYSYDGLGITDGKANALRLNKAFERITGVSPQVCLGRNMADLVKEGLFTCSGSLMVAETGQAVTIPIECKNGKNVLLTSSPIFNENGEIELIVTNMRDLTDLIELEEKLKNVQELRRVELDAIVSSSFDGLYITDGNAKTLRLNKGFERMTGITAERCLGRTMQELVRDGVFSDSGTLHALEKRETVTIQLTAISGKSYLVTSTPVFNDQGEIILVVSNVRDMTELEELERRLENVERLHRKELDAIYDSSYDGLYITDGFGNTISLNKGFERIMGVTADECVGRNMSELVKEGVFTASGTLLALESKETTTITLQSKTGKNALVTSTPIFDKDDNIVMVVTNVRDMTELNELQGKVEQLESLSKVYQSQLNDLKTSKTCIMHSEKMRKLMKLINHIAMVDSTVLIMGESGVGKEVVANIFHSNGSRSHKPFIKVNCGAIPHNLLESELFGYEAGAFSGASKTGKPGLFELADGGILFLDEIAELPMDLQVKLLRVLQDSKIMRIGGTKEITVDVRILAGTNRNLQQMVAENTFRKDLYYRLNVVPIIIPPLRERREDIPVLAKHFLEMYNRRYNLNKRISVPVMKYFVSYDWPGNVRELENLIERLVVTTLHDIIVMEDIASWAQLETAKPLSTDIIPLNLAVETTERNLLQLAFSKYNSTYAVARALGVSQATIVRKANKYGISKAANN